MFRLSAGRSCWRRQTTVPGFAPSDDPVVAQDHFPRHVGIADAKEDAVGVLCHLPRRIAEDALFVFGELARLFGGMRPERDLVSGAEKVAGHGVAHDAQSEESKICHKPGLYYAKNPRKVATTSECVTTPARIPPA